MSKTTVGRIHGQQSISTRHPAANAVSIDLEVPFHDVDALRIVWHGHYFRYLDLARTALMRARGLDVGDLAALRYRMVVAESHCRHISSLRYADRFRVAAWVVEAQNRIRIAYLIRNLSLNRRVARAQTVLVTTDHDGNLLWETPAEIRDRLLA